MNFTIYSISLLEQNISTLNYLIIFYAYNNTLTIKHQLLFRIFVVETFHKVSLKRQILIINK